MSRFTVKFLVGCLLLSFGIFFGVDLATKGIERINGPVKESKQTAAKVNQQQARESDKVKAAAQASAASKVKQDAAQRAPKESAPPPAAPAPLSAQLNSDSLINRIGNKTGELLQILAHHGIRMFTSFFDGIFK